MAVISYYYKLLYTELKIMMHLVCVYLIRQFSASEEGHYDLFVTQCSYVTSHMGVMSRWAIQA